MVSASNSFTEPHLSTDNELVRDVLLAVLASLAKLERQKISDRTKAGLDRARARGKRLGRAPLSAARREELRMVLDGGASWHAVCVQLGIPYGTTKKYARLRAAAAGEVGRGVRSRKSAWLILRLTISAISRSKTSPPAVSKSYPGVSAERRGPKSSQI